MKTVYCAFLFLSSSFCLAARSNKPTLLVQKDGLPDGHDTPEGVACDLARAFIKHDVNLFKKACIKPFGGANRQAYQTFLTATSSAMNSEGKKATPSPFGPKSIGKLFAARHLTKQGPASYGSAVFGFKDIEFVDVGVFLQDGKRSLNRTLVIEDADGKWYVDPLPTASPLLCEGLNEESASTQDFSQAYSVKRR